MPEAQALGVLDAATRGSCIAWSTPWAKPARQYCRKPHTRTASAAISSAARAARSGIVSVAVPFGTATRGVPGVTTTTTLMSSGTAGAAGAGGLVLGPTHLGVALPVEVHGRGTLPLLLMPLGEAVPVAGIGGGEGGEDHDRGGGQERPGVHGEAP
jgi:hypothetical protein